MRSLREEVSLFSSSKTKILAKDIVQKCSCSMTKWSTAICSSQSGSFVMARLTLMNFLLRKVRESTITPDPTASACLSLTSGWKSSQMDRKFLESLRNSLTKTFTNRFKKYQNLEPNLNPFFPTDFHKELYEIRCILNQNQ